jgi:hypothetical protein
MRVWVNSIDEGWVQHGLERSSPERAVAVARLLAQQLGWETAAGATPPPPHPAQDGAPPASIGRKSPAPLRRSPRVRPAQRPVVETTGASADSEPYFDELVSFALEAQLRDFIIGHLPRISVGGTSLRLYRDKSGRSGREYPTEVGPIDILAVAPDGTLVVIELKLDRGPDRALGQLARYMGWVRANLAAGAEVRGAVVARRIDEKLRYAAAAMPGVLLLEYEVDFRVREVAAL